MYVSVQHCSVESGATSDLASAIGRELVPLLRRDASVDQCDVVNAGGGTVVIVERCPTWREIDRARRITEAWMQTHEADFDVRVMSGWVGEQLAEWRSEHHSAIAS